MNFLRRYRSTPEQRLERWIGAAQLDALREGMRHWYGPPIAIHNVPGEVWAYPGGDLVGPIRGGGFSSLGDLISEATAGKRREFFFQKIGVTGVVGASYSHWTQGNFPAAGSAPAAAPGGAAPDDTTTGSWTFDNPTGGDTQHVVSGFPSSSVAGMTMLLYDRLFGVAKTMSSTGTEAVTGVPTRYQSTTASNPDYVGGNFLFMEATAVLGATAHNWTVCTYKDQADAASTLPSIAGISSCAATRLDMPLQQWFAPLETGDVGVKALTQMQCSASVTGTLNFTIGHPLAWLPCPIANLICVADGINTAFNLVRVFDDACMALLDITRPATTAPTFTGSFTTVRG